MLYRTVFSNSHNRVEFSGIIYLSMSGKFSPSQRNMVFFLYFVYTEINLSG